MLDGLALLLKLKTIRPSLMRFEKTVGLLMKSVNDYPLKLLGIAQNTIAQFIIYLNDDSITQNFTPTFSKFYDLRYGENPHQKAAAYKAVISKDQSILNATIHQGKQLSYNNLMDADAALACLREFTEPTCVVVKTWKSLWRCFEQFYNECLRKSF